MLGSPRAVSCPGHRRLLGAAALAGLAALPPAAAGCGTTAELWLGDGAGGPPPTLGTTLARCPLRRERGQLMLPLRIRISRPVDLSTLDMQIYVENGGEGDRLPVTVTPSSGTVSFAVLFLALAGAPPLGRRI